MPEDPLIDPFNHAHTNSDVDIDVDSMHHTLGKGPQQAAPGDHSGHLITGSVNMYAGNVIPAGWLLCDGSAVPRATYPELFGTIGTTYGVGDGSTTFNLPNFTNAFPRGNTVTPSGGNDSHTHTVSTSGSTSANATGVSTQSALAGGLAAVASGQSLIGTHNHGVSDPTHSHSTSASGNTASSNNIPKYVGLKFIIKV